MSDFAAAGGAFASDTSDKQLAQVMCSATGVSCLVVHSSQPARAKFHQAEQ